jgi:hypothetical protein
MAFKQVLQSVIIEVGGNCVSRALFWLIISRRFVSNWPRTCLFVVKAHDFFTEPVQSMGYTSNICQFLQLTANSSAAFFMHTIGQRVCVTSLEIYVLLFYYEPVIFWHGSINIFLTVCDFLEPQ